MNALGVAMVWCAVQVTLLGLLAIGAYFLVRRLCPAAGASVLGASLMSIVGLSLLVASPWPRWTFISPLPLAGEGTESVSPLPQAGEGQGVRGDSPVNAMPESVTTRPRPNPLPLAGEGTESVSPLPPAEEGSESFSLDFLWQSLVAELTEHPSTDTWRWPAVLAIVFLAMMLCGLGWLLLGLLAVRFQRRRSRPVLDQGLRELIDVLRAELGCRREVEIRESDDLTTAATIGWRRPVLLLPNDWTTWTPEQRRAVLAHEMAHARSHDFLALLVGQFGLAIHFYHPLLHWLIGRLRLEQELAADAAAASISGGQRHYLHTIAELALAQHARPMRWPARSFLPTQSTFLRRIAMLRDSTLRFDRPSIVTRAAAIGLVLIGGLFVAGLRAPGVSGPALAADAERPAADDSIDTTFMMENASIVAHFSPSVAVKQNQAQSSANLKNIALSMLVFENEKKHFPPAVFYGPDGKTPYSWRVALLPYLDRKDLYDQYHFDEPWDGPNNRKLLDKMPEVFRCPTESAGSTNASYFVLTGPATVFDPNEPKVGLAAIRDGSSSTFLAVEAKRDIPWTKPEDIRYDSDKPLPALGGFCEGIFYAAMVDGSVWPFRNDAPEETLRRLIEKADGKPVDRDDAAVQSDPNAQVRMVSLVEDFLQHNFRDVTSRETLHWGNVTKTGIGNSSIRYKYRARFWYGEPTTIEQVFTFTPDGKFVSVEDVDNGEPLPPAKVSEIHKKVSDFPDREDLTTPETAYATIQRAYAAEGDAAWPRLSVPWLAEHMPKVEKKPLTKEAADRLLDAEILEVHVWSDKNAVVLARETGRNGPMIDMRWLTRVDNSWLNDGNDMPPTIEEARRKIEQARRRLK